MKNVCLTLVCSLCLMSPVLAQEAGQKVFATPEEASKALVETAGKGDQASLAALVGPGVKDIIINNEQSKERRERFLAAAKDGMHWVAVNDKTMMLMVGKEAFPLPLPLVKGDKGWYFDSNLAREELRARQIGANELETIKVCQTYVDAQREYSALDPDGDGLPEYAQRMVSSAGKHDGLYWEAGPDQRLSPLGPLVAKANLSASKDGKPQPFHGYYFKILTQQGPAAPGGAMNYLINGHMVAGFSLVAYPAKYGESGIMTFLVSPGGQVYERDLKDQTATAAPAIDSFNPESGWKKL